MSATETKAEGKTDELKGKAQEAWGNVTGDDEDKAKGEANQVKGHTKQAWGNLREAGEKLAPND